MTEEHDELAARLVERQEDRIAGRTVVRGRMAGRPVILSESGVGKVAAAATATLLIHAFGCRAVVVAGVAGGVDPGISIGDVVIADRMIQHDYGHRSNEGLRHYRPGVPPLGSARQDIEFLVAPSLLALLRDSLSGLVLPDMPPDVRPPAAGGAAVRLFFGPIVSGDQFINSELARDELHRVHGAMAVEMEGAAVAQVAETFGIPCIVVRSVSDRAGADSHLDFPRFIGVTAPIAADIVARIVAIL
jgi:adenosylhomocysteine nucleosidase